jgi:hypothetical protein
MSRFSTYALLCAIMTVALVDCGGGGAVAPQVTSAPPTAVAATATSSSVQAGPTSAATTQAGPTSTPDNSVATAAPNSANTSFQSAQSMGKSPLKVSVKESTFYYKVDVSRGGVVSATLTVDGASPAPAKLSMFDENQNYLDEVSVPAGRSGQLRHIFNQKGGGTTYLTLAGNSIVTLAAETLNQNDGGSKGDAGDSLDNATALALGQTSGLLGNADTEDDFMLDLPKSGGVLSTTVRTSDGSIKLSVYNDGQNYIGETSTDKNKTQGASFQTVLGANEGGHWLISVSGSGAYSLITSFGPQNDGASGKDAGNDIDSALALKPGSYTGLLGGSDGSDVYVVNLSKSGGTFSVTLSTTDGSVKAAVYDDGKNYITEIATDKNKPGGEAVATILRLNQGGNWFIDISGSGSYAFSVAFAQQNDGGSGKDAGDSKDTAITVKEAKVSGMIGGADESDYYRIPATLGRKINVKFGRGQGTLKVSLYDLNDAYIKEIAVEPSGSGDLVEDSGGKGDYVVAVSGGSGEYTLNISK